MEIEEWMKENEQERLEKTSQLLPFVDEDDRIKEIVIDEMTKMYKNYKELS